MRISQVLRALGEGLLGHRGEDDTFFLPKAADYSDKAGLFLLFSVILPALILSAVELVILKPLFSRWDHAFQARVNGGRPGASLFIPEIAVLVPGNIVLGWCLWQLFG